MKKYEKTITAYDLSEGFTVEVDRVDGVSEFYICHRDYGDKMHMFGLPDSESISEEEIIKANAETYIMAFNKIITSNNE